MTVTDVYSLYYLFTSSNAYSSQILENLTLKNWQPIIIIEQLKNTHAS